MPAEVLYRKWRPQRFADVAGQEPITRTLRNAVAAGKVSHAYLFSGPRGTGKTTTARIFAKAVNCASPEDGEPCGRCPSCVDFAEGRAMDLIELDAASNRGIDEVRGIREKANYAPAIGPHKLYLIDEVHMLTEPAFNALLKTLEEPPAHVIFVLATTELQKVPATILSRCQRFDFRRIPVSAMADRLEVVCAGEGITCPREGLEEIARLATGSARDAINLLEQLVDYRGRTLTMADVRAVLDLSGDERAQELAAHALHGRLAEGLETIAAVRDDGVDLRRFQRDVVAALRELLLLKSGVERRSRWSAPELDAMRAVIADVPVERIVAALRAFGEADLRADPLSPLPLELALAATVMPASQPAPGTGTAPSPSGQPRPPLRPRTAAGSPPVRDAADGAPASSQPPTPAGAGAALIDRIRAEASAMDKRQAGWINGSCYVESFENGVLTLAFYDTYSLHKSKVEASPVKEFIEQVASKVLGEPVKLRCIMSERKPRGGHTVERLIQQHGARIVSRE
jgi:DNA polymerase-3 subunit gamma/tau